MWIDLASRLRALFRRSRVDAELEEELRFHLDHETRKLEQSGLPRAEAARRARLTFGGLDQVREECRDARGVRLIETLARDVRCGIRLLLRNPAYACVTLLTLAIGIGANTAMFSAVYALLLRPYRFPGADRTVSIEARHISGTNQNAGYRDFLDWREQNHVFEEMAISPWTGTYTLTGMGEPQRMVGAATTHGFLRVLGIRPPLGRFFDPEEDRPGAPRVAVLSCATWERRFGGSPDVLGRTLTLNGAPYTVIGVMPRGFAFPGIRTWEFLTALRENPANGRFQHQYGVLARMKPGVALSEAQAAMDTITRRLEQEFPETNLGWRAAVTPIREAISRETRRPVQVLFATVSFVLLLVCANIAGLQLARASSRAREMALRASLGAGRLRLVWQTLTESLVLSLTGGALGLLLAQWLVQAMRNAAPEDLGLDSVLSLDIPVLLFAASISVLTGIAFGLVPALYGANSDLNGVMKAGARGTPAGKSQSLLMSCLISGEISLALVLLVGAGLLLKDLVWMLRVDTGLRTEHILTVALDPPRGGTDPLVRAEAFYHDLLGRLRNAPGVESAVILDTLPMTGGMTGGGFEVEGRVKAVDWVETLVQYNGSTPDFFRTFGVPLLRGRDFDAHDGRDARPVAIVNDVLARRFFPEEDPIGHRFRDSYDGQWRTIVGIVASYKSQRPFNPPAPQVFRPLSQTGFGSQWVALRTRDDPEVLARDVRSIVRALDADVPVLRLRSMSQVVADSLAEPRSIARFVSAFAGFALLLAAIGVYGIVAYSVRQRLPEMGIRMALGATPADVVLLVLRKGALLASTGVLMGLPAALASSTLLSSLLHGIEPHSLVVFVAVPAGLAAVTLAASYLPARRAAKVDPTVALRYE